MRVAIIIFAVLFIVLFAGAIPIGKTIYISIFYSLAFFIPCLALCVSLLICSFKRRKRWREPGFHLTHLGIVIILCGAFFSYWGGIKTQFKFPIGVELDSIPIIGDEVLELGFKLEVKDFEVEYHPPVYALYEYSQDADSRKVQEQFTYLASLKTTPSGIFIENYGQVSLSQLKDVGRSHTWQTVLQIDEKRFLKLEQLTPSLYSAKLALTDETGQKREEILQVNRPFTYRNWKFYLMSYDNEEQKYIVVSAYNDPGRLLVISGLWLVIISTFYICLFNKGFSKQKGEL